MDPQVFTFEVRHPHELADILIDVELPEAERPHRDEVVHALIRESRSHPATITVSWEAYCWLSDWLAVQAMEDRPFLDAPDPEHVRWSQMQSWAKEVAEQY